MGGSSQPYSLFLNCLVFTKIHLVLCIVYFAVLINSKFQNKQKRLAVHFCFIKLGLKIWFTIYFLVYLLLNVSF